MIYRPLADIAAECGVHVKTLLRAVHDGRLRAYRFGRGFVVSPSDLAEWRERCATIPTGRATRPSEAGRGHSPTLTPADDELKRRAAEFIEEKKAHRDAPDEIKNAPAYMSATHRRGSDGWEKL